MRAVAAFLQLLVVATISIGVSVIIDYYPQLYQDNITLIRGMLIARGLAKLSIEIPLLYQFLLCFFIFVNKKLTNKKSLTQMHRFIIAWTVVLGFLRFYIALCLSTIGGIY